MREIKETVGDFFLPPEQEKKIKYVLDAKKRVDCVMLPVVESLRDNSNKLTEEELERIAKILTNAALDINNIKG